MRRICAWGVFVFVLIALGLPWQPHAGAQDNSPTPLFEINLGSQKNLASVAWSADGSRLLVGSTRQAQVFDLLDKKEVLKFEGTDKYTLVRWSPQETYIAASGRDNLCRIWDAATGQPLYKWPFINEGEQPLQTFWLDETRIALYTLWGQPEIIVMDVQTGATVFTLRHAGRIFDVRLSPDGKQLLVTTDVKFTDVWAEQSSLLGLPVNSSDTLPGTVIYAWDVQTGELRYTLPLLDDLGGTAPILSQDGSRLLTNSLKHDSDEVQARLAAATTKDDWLANGPDYGTITMWDTATQTANWFATEYCPLFSLRQDYFFTEAAWSPDESRVITWANGGPATVWDALDGTPLFQVDPPDKVHAAWWSAEPSLIITFSDLLMAGDIPSPEDGPPTLRTWDAQTGELRSEREFSDGYSGTPTWNAPVTRGAWVYAAQGWADDSPSEVVIIDVEGHELARLPHRGYIKLNWNPAGDRLVTFDGVHILRVWDFSTLITD